MMKTIAGMLAAMILIAAPAAAQRPGPGGRGAGDRPEMMGGPAGLGRAVDLALSRRDSLALSGDQVQRLEAFKAELERNRTAMREELEQARADAGGDRAQIRERMEALQERMRAAREDERERFEGILTEPQRERLQQLSRQDRRRGPGGADGPGRRGRRGPGGGAGFQRGALGAAFGPGPGAAGFGRGAGLGRGAGFGRGAAPGRRAAFGAGAMGGYREGYMDGLRAARRGAGARGRLAPLRQGR
jgi:hypothetical protein